MRSFILRGCVVIVVAQLLVDLMDNNNLVGYNVDDEGGDDIINYYDRSDNN